MRNFFINLLAVILFCLGVVIFFTIIFYLGIAALVGKWDFYNYQSNCTERSAVKTVQPVSHLLSTAYYVTASSGASMDFDEPPVIGKEACFKHELIRREE